MDLFTSTAYAMGGSTGGQGTGGGGGIVSFLPIILIFAVFYFLVMMPQQKQRKKHEEMIGKLQKGDKVVTSSGIHGTVVGVDDGRRIVVLRVGEDNTKIEFDKSAIARMESEKTA